METYFESVNWFEFLKVLLQVHWCYDPGWLVLQKYHNVSRQT